MDSSFLHFGDSVYEVWGQMRVTSGEQLKTEPPVSYILVISLLASTVTGIFPRAPLSHQALAFSVFSYSISDSTLYFSAFGHLPPLARWNSISLVFLCKSNFVFHPLLVSGASKTFLPHNAFTTQASTPDPTLYLQRKMGRGFATSDFPSSLSGFEEKEEKRRDVLPHCWYELCHPFPPYFPSEGNNEQEGKKARKQQ